MFFHYWQASQASGFSREHTIAARSSSGFIDDLTGAVDSFLTAN
jgi:hypothetical protein